MTILARTNKGSSLIAREVLGLKWFQILEHIFLEFDEPPVEKAVGFCRIGQSQAVSDIIPFLELALGEQVEIELDTLQP